MEGYYEWEDILKRELIWNSQEKQPIARTPTVKLPTTVLRIAGLNGLSANLEFAEVTSNFYGSKAIYKGSKGFGPLNGGLAPEGLSSEFFDSRKPLKRHLQGFGAEATFEL